VQAGDFVASRCPGGYLLVEVIQYEPNPLRYSTRYIGVGRSAALAVGAVTEIALRNQTDGWLMEDGHGSETPVVRGRPI
jgi:hypothetical protein